MGDGDADIRPGPCGADEDQCEEFAFDDCSKWRFSRLDEGSNQNQERCVAEGTLGRSDEKDNHADPGE